MRALERLPSGRLEEAYPYLILDARYERVREGGVIRSQAVLIAIGINDEGRRADAGRGAGQPGEPDQLAGLSAGAERARAARAWSSWSPTITTGLKRAIAEVLPEAAWQRCYVHFLRNALDHLPRKAEDDCLQELRWLYDRRDLAEAQQGPGAWLERWQSQVSPSSATGWRRTSRETLTFYRLPLEHHKHLKSTNMLERLNEEIKRRTRVVRIFPNEASCLRLVRALAVETHEDWLEANRYLNMDTCSRSTKDSCCTSST